MGLQSFHAPHGGADFLGWRRTRTGATLVGVIRGGIFRPNPAPEYTFAGEDIVAIVGSPGEREQFKALAAGHPEPEAANGSPD